MMNSNHLLFSEINIPDFTGIIEVILVPLSFVVRYSFVLIIIGFILITTTLSDALGKTSIAFGLVGLLIKIFLVDYLNHLVGYLDLMAISRTFLEAIGISDIFVIDFILKIANATWAFAMVIGFILYFIDFGNSDVKKRGYKLIVRGIILFIVLQILPHIMLTYKGILF